MNRITSDDVKNHFPADLASSETADLFMSVIMYRLTGASEKALLSNRGNRNVRNMRQFYLTFPNCYAPRSNLSWTHYRMLMRVENEKARNFYLQECEKANWSTRQLERQIDSFFDVAGLSKMDALFKHA